MDERLRIADYELVRVVDQLVGTRVLARPPQRLALGDPFVMIKIPDGRHSGERFDDLVTRLRQFAAVPSPHLMPLYDAGERDGQVWYSMRHYPLGTLARPLHPTDRDEVLRAVAHAARGAHALHESGIAHLDIRPATVFLDVDGAALGEPGTAQVLSPGQTVSRGSPIGHLEFTDPGLLRGEAPSRAGDVWALGLTLHRALTRTSAYPELAEGQAVLSAVRRVLNGGPTLSERLDSPTSALVRACISPDPADRPATAADLADRIEAL